MKDSTKFIATNMLSDASKRIDRLEPINYFEEVETFRRQLITDALYVTNNNIAMAARLLNLNRTTLTEMIRKYREKDMNPSGYK